MELQLKKRFAELAEKSYMESRYLFTDFLGIAELDDFYQLQREEKITHYLLWGGYGQAERQMLCFGNPQELGYEQSFPIACIRITPLIKKFSDDFTHRDFLGALMNLGMDRGMLGDILLGDREAYLFAKETMAEYIIEHLDQVKHTSVRCSICKELPEICKTEPVEEEYVVASDRIDAVVSKVCRLSRSQAILLFQEKKIYVNGRLCENNSGQLKPQDVLTVRGVGRMIYDGIRYENKKGKFCIGIRRYQ